AHDAENARRQRTEQREIHHVQRRAQNGEAERYAGERQRHGIADQQQRADGDHHRNGENFAHCGRRPASTSAARIVWAMPCKPIRSANSGMSVLSRYTNGKPLVSREPSRMAQDRSTYGSDSAATAMANGKRKTMAPTRSTTARRRGLA